MENKNIYKSLLAAQKQIDCAVKDSTNPHYKSRYESLESVIDAVKKPLNDHGIVIIHNTTSDMLLITKLVHAESGEFVESVTPLILSKQDMQQLGSAETYAKRQNLKCLTNLPSEDDDGNSVSQQSKPQIKQTPKTNTLGIQTANEFMSNNPNEYIINLSPTNKLTGTKLSDHKPEWIRKNIDSTIEYHAKLGKEMHPNTKQFVEKATVYLKSLPNFNSDESIPF